MQILKVLKLLKSASGPMGTKLSGHIKYIIAKFLGGSAMNKIIRANTHVLHRSFPSFCLLGGAVDVPPHSIPPHPQLVFVGGHVLHPRPTTYNSIFQLIKNARTFLHPIIKTHIFQQHLLHLARNDKHVSMTFLHRSQKHTSTSRS